MFSTSGGCYYYISLFYTSTLYIDYNYNFSLHVVPVVRVDHLIIYEIYFTCKIGIRQKICFFLPLFSSYFNQKHAKTCKNRKVNFSTSVGIVKHPNAGQNRQHKCVIFTHQRILMWRNWLYQVKTKTLKCCYVPLSLSLLLFFFLFFFLILSLLKHAISILQT